MVELLRRAARFLISGGLSTGVAYLSLIALLPHVPFMVAATLSWLLSLLCGFALNRRFTFNIEGNDGRLRDFRSFALGAALQYLVAMAGYALLIGKLHLNPSLAFVVNLGLTTTFSFAYLNLVTFRRAT